jgi:hypothetical protein
VCFAYADIPLAHVAAAVARSIDVIIQAHAVDRLSAESSDGSPLTGALHWT